LDRTATQLDLGGSAPVVAPPTAANPSPVALSQAPSPPPEATPLLPFERRLDAVVLPASAATARGARGIPAYSHPVATLVPLHLESPVAPSALDGVNDGRGLPFAADEPRPLRGLVDESTRPDVIVPFEPARRSIAGGSAVPSESIRARLRSLVHLPVDPAPPRPLPAATDDIVDVGSGPKTLNSSSLARFGVRLSAFSSRDTDDDVDLTLDGDDFVDPDLIEDRENRAPAAVVISALSDEGPGDVDPFDAFSEQAAAGTEEDLETLAEAFGLGGALVIPRSTPRGADDGALSDAVSLDTRVGCDAVTDSDLVELDAHELEELVVTDIGGEILSSTIDEDAAAFLDENEVTPARGTVRPALIAPQAIRFVVADRPARARPEALSPEESARNRQRAHELYLIALDDVGDGDVAGAIGHLQLAVAYDDQTDVYRELLEQLSRKLRRAS
jgi:hypothetical protein